MPNIVKAQRTAKRPAPLTQCPCGPDGLTFATLWYRLPGIESFFICSKCFEDKIANTQFAGLFDSFHNEPLPGTKSICDFNSERMDQILARAIRSGKPEQLFAFAEHRSGIAPCYGVGGTRGGHDVRWFTNPELPGFIVCEACYEDFILATSFASRFIPHPEDQMLAEVWICDLSIPFIRRSLLDLGRSGDWHNFVNAVSYRSSISACDPNPVPLATRKWFRPIKPCLIPKLMVCEACYLDRVGSLPAASFFSRVHPKAAELQNQVVCAFQTKSIQAHSERLLKEAYGRWHHLINQMVTKPSCSKGDIEGDWYTLPDPKNTSRDISNFEICGACYLGYIEAAGHASAFRKVTYPSGTTRVCDFSTITPRHHKFMQKWSEMIFTGTSKPLADYAARITKITQCGKTKIVSRARWWGMDEFLFCAECYEESGKGSYFAPLFNYQATGLPEGRCDMYSDNMRRRYLEACRDRSLDDFLSYCRYREEIWQLVQQETKRHKALLKMNERAYSQGMLMTMSNYSKAKSNSNSNSNSNSSHGEPSKAIVPAGRPGLVKQRRVSAPAKFESDHRMTEENLKRAQRKAVRESMQKSPMLLHLQLRWSEVE